MPTLSEKYLFCLNSKSCPHCTIVVSICPPTHLVHSHHHSFKLLDCFSKPRRFFRMVINILKLAYRPLNCFFFNPTNSWKECENKLQIKLNSSPHPIDSPHVVFLYHLPIYVFFFFFKGSIQQAASFIYITTEMTWKQFRDHCVLHHLSAGNR